ncbi:MAG TPA: transporter substrate-binding domain-containing protein [Candidatus Nesterenkonia stercoripullorum]|uniref:Transporter substrate-binding domain-containing protein n=1 Tax=Candidatus Nesterenkonia stercoripullorum TaxID=2838701 RepID=A0A9D1UUX0_9MICC|nr:transporter substrate-binding domain-containing protein [Candidatus Nesterenkonia stercoripullorum]
MTHKTSLAVRTTATGSIVLLALAGCGSNGDNGGEGDGDTLNIALFGEEPYSWLDDSGEPTGATIAVAEEIFGERMGYDIEVEQTDWDNLIPGLNAGNWDVVSAGMSINADRCAEAEFGEPELLYTTSLLVEEGNPLDVNDFDDLLEAQESGENIDVVALTGGVEAPWMDDMGIDYEGVGNAQDGIDFVEGERADVFALTAISLSTMAGDSDSMDVTEPFSHELSVGAHTFRPEDDDLREEFNEHLNELKESGEYLDIVSEFGFTEDEMPPADLTAQELCDEDPAELTEEYLDN